MKPTHTQAEWPSLQESSPPRNISPIMLCAKLFLVICFEDGLGNFSGNMLSIFLYIIYHFIPQWGDNISQPLALTPNFKSWAENLCRHEEHANHTEKPLAPGGFNEMAKLKIRKRKTLLVVGFTPTPLKSWLPSCQREKLEQCWTNRNCSNNWHRDSSSSSTISNISILCFF